MLVRSSLLRKLVSREIGLTSQSTNKSSFHLHCLPNQRTKQFSFAAEPIRFTPDGQVNMKQITSKKNEKKTNYIEIST
jgi:hypothetical protein